MTSVLLPSDALFDRVRGLPLDRLLPRGWRRTFEPVVERVFVDWYDERFRGWVRIASVLLAVFWTLRLGVTVRDGNPTLIAGVGLVAASGWASFGLLRFTRVPLSVAHWTMVPGTGGVCLTVYGLTLAGGPSADVTRLAMAVFQLALSLPLGFRLRFRWCVPLLIVSLTMLIGALATQQGTLDQRLATQWLSALVFSLTVAFLLERDARGEFANRATIHRLATTDALSGALRRATFVALAERALAQRPGSLIMLDVDHFKALNDQHGHRAGDAAITALGDWVRGEAPAEALFARLGGEEFALLLPGGDLDGGARLAEQLRAKFEAARLVEGPTTIQFTASFGVAEGRDLPPLLKRADDALYEAKRERNRVVRG